MPRHTKHYGDCVYCGEYDKLTKDHVIPLCLFSEDTLLPHDIPKVYACKDCNNIVKSANDRYFRDFLAVDMDSSKHPIAQQLFEKFARATIRKQSEFALDFMQSQQIMELFTQSGIFTERVYTSQRANQRFIPILEMMTRGLDRAYVKEQLPKDSTFDIFRIRDLTKLRLDVQMLDQMGGCSIIVGDGEVFQCAYGAALDRPEISLWFLCFYRSVFFGVITNHRARIANVAS